MKSKRGFFQKSEDGRQSSVAAGRKGKGWRFLLIVVLLGGLLWAASRYGFSLLAGLDNLWEGLNGGESSKELISDNIPPSPPQIAPLPEATNSASLDILGSAEAGSTLDLFLNGAEVKKVLVGDKGRFRLGSIKLTEGENNIFAKAVDEAGNESQESIRQTIIYDKEPPTLEIESPKDGKSFFGDQKEIDIRGKTEKDAIVNINERKVIVNLDGSFDSVYSLSEGPNEISIVASDKAGNKTQKSLKVYYQP